MCIWHLDNEITYLLYLGCILLGCMVLRDKLYSRQILYHHEAETYLLPPVEHLLALSSIEKVCHSLFPVVFPWNASYFFFNTITQT